MILYKCPVCDSDVEVEDTLMRTSDNHFDMSTVVTVETKIRHRMPTFNAQCGAVFEMFAKEHQNQIQRTAERIKQQITEDVKK